MLVTLRVKDLLKYQPLKRNQDKLKKLSMVYGIPEDKILIMFASFLAVVIRRRIVLAIERQRLGRVTFKQMYKPLNKDYARRKGNNKFWVNTGYLKDNISVFKKHGEIYIGFKDNTKKRRKYNKVITYMEKGTKRMSARPLIKPTFESVAKNVGYYLKKFEIVGIAKGVLVVRGSSKGSLSNTKSKSGENVKPIDNSEDWGDIQW